MAGKDNVKHIEYCSVSNALGTWVFSVAGALLAIPVGIKRKSLAPLVFFFWINRYYAGYHYGNQAVRKGACRAPNEATWRSSSCCK